MSRSRYNHESRSENYHNRKDDERIARATAEWHALLAAETRKPPEQNPNREIVEFEGRQMSRGMMNLILLKRAEKTSN